MGRLTAEPVSKERAELGEGVRWDAERQEVLWVDILGHVLRRARWNGAALETVREYALDRPIGAVTPVAAGGYLLAAGDGLAWLGEDGRLDPFASVCGGDDSLRMNDAACDPAGRFWAGSMPYDTSRIGAATLAVLDTDLSLRTALPDVTISNGLVWNTAADRLYYNDSASNVVWVFDYDLDGGTIRNRRPFAEIDGGVPDGMCRDDEDHLWVAVHGAARVDRLDLSGQVVESVDVPGADQVSCCAFGGADRSTLFVTTATEGMDGEARAAHPAAGYVHAVATGTTGPPVTPFAGRPAPSR